MYPDLEFFLEKTFGGIPPTSPEIGRVVVEPDYDVAPDAQDAGQLASELLQCLSVKRTDTTRRLRNPQGYEIEIPGAYRLLRKYIRRIVLHADKIEGEWVEVAPPGNWI